MDALRFDLRYFSFVDKPTSWKDGDFCEYMDVSPVHDATASHPEMRCPICLEVPFGSTGGYRMFFFKHAVEDTVDGSELRPEKKTPFWMFSKGRSKEWYW